MILPVSPVVISSGAVTDDPWPNQEESGPREASYQMQTSVLGNKQTCDHAILLTKSAGLKQRAMLQGCKEGGWEVGR